MKKMNLLLIIGIALVVISTSYTIIRFYPKNSEQFNFKPKQDTVKVIPDTPVSAKGKNVLYIGDSHTSNHVFGWQVLVSKLTGMNMTNTAVGGKMTPWMYEVAKQNVSEKYSYCFVYGGANDCFSFRDVNVTLSYLQGIANLCKEKGVKCYVLTGFDPLTCVKTNSNYPKLYDSLQRMMITNLKDCQVVDCRKAVVRRNCWDYLCHMNQDGHKAIAECVIKTANLKKIK